jgi:septal ring factor EnvC (AmiA/AmiB activator)
VSLEWWKSFFEIGGVVLLLLTFAFGAGALIVNKRLNAIQDAELRQFDKRLTDAKTELGKQQVLASDATAKVAGLEEDVAAAKTEMAKQQMRAATAEQSLLELQQKLNWRKISAQQRRKFLAASAAEPKGLVEITAVNGDSEAKAFAEQMRTLLKEAGWDSPPVTTGSHTAGR